MSKSKTAEDWAARFTALGMSDEERREFTQAWLSSVTEAMASARAEALEEAALIADRRRDDCDHLWAAGKAIRALKKGGA